MEGLNKIALKFILAGVSILFLSFFMVNTQAMAQDGKTLYTTKTCVACHGPDGKTPLLPMYPKLAGQNSQYLIDQMKAFKDKKRSNGQSALMWGMAAQLSDADIKKIADYLAKVK